MRSLSFRAVSKRFDGQAALERVDLDIPAGSITAIVGPSGCGKTTLLEMAAGLQRPTEGEVAIDGRPVTAPTPEAVMIFQHHNLFPWLSVRDNVAFGLRSAGLSRGDARARAMRQLGDVGLAAFAAKVPSELSGGMRQRVALARALVLEPEILLMDEPFASLDHQTRRLMHRHLLATWRRGRPTVALVTHDLDEALALGDRIVLMSRSPGRVATVVDLDGDRPRSPGDAGLATVRRRLERHLEREVAAEEFTSAEIEELLEDRGEPVGAGSRGG